MRRNHRPLWLVKIIDRLCRYYVELKIRPQFDEVGSGLRVFEPTSLVIFGRKITAGEHLHIISHKLKPVQLCTWSSKQQQGQINVGNYVLISPGAQINSAEEIHIGDNCMIAAEALINDSDWHGTYNRTRPFQCSRPVVIKNNVWIGQRAIVNKGLTIGENSVIAAGAVVVNDIPANTIVGGNPATVIKTIDPNKRMLSREFLFTQATDYDDNQRLLTEYLCEGNTTLSWLRSLLWLNPDD